MGDFRRYRETYLGPGSPPDVSGRDIRMGNPNVSGRGVEVLRARNVGTSETSEPRRHGRHGRRTVRDGGEETNRPKRTRKSEVESTEEESPEGTAVIEYTWGGTSVRVYWMKLQEYRGVRETSLVPVDKQMNLH